VGAQAGAVADREYVGLPSLPEGQNVESGTTVPLSF
jgi:hypothetical protein